MKTLSKIISLLMVLCLVLALGVTALADSIFTPDRTTGSITIHKYEFNGQPGDPAPGTELSVQDLPQGAIPMAGVTFTVYKLVDSATLQAYYNSTLVNAETSAKIDAMFRSLNNNVVQGTDGSYIVYDVTGAAVTGSGLVTDANGLAKFENLPLGLYAVIETDAPSKVTNHVEPFLVSLPMTIDGNSWLYDVHVYPKNSTSEGNVILTKTDTNGSPLPGVTFRLETGSGDNYTKVTESTTDPNGKITWNNLSHGWYRFVETACPEGYIRDDVYFSFHIDENNTITCTDNRPLLVQNTFNTSNKTLYLTLQNEKPTVTKEFTTGKDAAGVGDEIYCEVNVDVPHNITALKDFFIEDTPAGMTVDIDDVEIYDGDTRVYTGLTVSYFTNSPGFCVRFAPTECAAYAGKTLTIKYKGVLTGDVVVYDKATNTATLVYSDRLTATSAERLYTSDTDESKTHTLNITKRLDSATGALASGVRFKLYEDAALTKPVKFSFKEGYAYPSSGSTVSELTTDANGVISIHGLANKTYYLHEIATVSGYNLLTEPVALNMAEADEFVLDELIINKAGFDLPKTGGLGTLMFILIGGILIAGGILLVTTSKKRAAR